MDLKKLNINPSASIDKAKKLVNEAGFRETKNSSDTVKIWENYREQAMLWRALALIQIPSTLIALIFASIMWLDSEVTLNVPAKPLEGYYKTDEVQDVEFLSAATEFLNLIATYQPNNAEMQFREAAKFLVEPILTRFEEEILDTELKAIVSTSRTQVFFTDPTKNVIDRQPGKVIVKMEGERRKWISGQELPLQLIEYTITLATIPRNTLNPYGIIVTDFSLTKAI